MRQHYAAALSAGSLRLRSTISRNHTGRRVIHLAWAPSSSCNWGGVLLQLACALSGRTRVSNVTARQRLPRAWHLSSCFEHPRALHYEFSIRDAVDSKGSVTPKNVSNIARDVLLLSFFVGAFTYRVCWQGAPAYHIPHDSINFRFNIMHVILLLHDRSWGLRDEREDVVFPGRAPLPPRSLEIWCIRCIVSLIMILS